MSKLVFVSYAREDTEAVKAICRELRERQVSVWFDQDDLKPGLWVNQVKRAITRSAYFIICLSEAALRKTGDKPGFQDEELSLAFDIARQQSSNSFMIIPLRIEDCDRGDHRIATYQQYDLFRDRHAVLDKIALEVGGAALNAKASRDDLTDDEAVVRRLINKSEALFVAGLFAGCLDLWKAVEAFSGETSETWTSKGVLEERMGRLDKALADFDKALALDSKHWLAHYNKGLTLEALGQTESAIEEFRRATSINSAFGPSHYNLGVCLVSQGHGDDAIAAYDAALRCDPDDLPALLNKGTVLSSLGRTTEAIETYVRAIQVRPGDGLVHYNLAVALFKLRLFEPAYRMVRRSIDLAPSPEAVEFKIIVAKTLGLLDVAMMDLLQTGATYLSAGCGRGGILASMFAPDGERTVEELVSVLIGLGIDSELALRLRDCRDALSAIEGIQSGDAAMAGLRDSLAEVDRAVERHGSTSDYRWFQFGAQLYEVAMLRNASSPEDSQIILDAVRDDLGVLQKLVQEMALPKGLLEEVNTFLLRAVDESPEVVLQSAVRITRTAKEILTGQFFPR